MTVRDVMGLCLQGGSNEFGLLGDDGLVHGYELYPERDDDGSIAFWIIKNLCNAGMMHKDRTYEEVATPNCLRCLARETFNVQLRR